MILALDTNPLFTSSAGVARYVGCLRNAFSSGMVFPGTVGDVAWKTSNLAYRQPARAFRTFYREMIWAPHVAPGLLRALDPDILHVTSFLRIPWDGVKVVTVYDFAAMDCLNRYRPWHRHAVLRFLRTLASFDRVICISKFTADEAMKRVGLPHKKIDVVYCGSDSLPESDGCLVNLNVPDEFLLFVGSLEPGKNLSMLCATWSLAKARGLHLPPLVIVGSRWDGVAREGEAPPDWLYLGHQPDGVVAGLYKKARALVFPSRYEGFGLPIVEAMRAGCPVVCSAVTAIPEAGGDAAVYAEMTPESYLNALTRVLSDDSFRSESVRRGVEHASRFSWKKCAEETYAVYRKALAD